MYEQVYYHKTRMAFDIMLRGTLKEALGKLPAPSKIDEFLKLDDYYIWGLAESKSPEWFTRLKNRQTLKELVREKEFSAEDYKKVSEALKENGIETFEKTTERMEPWYDKASEIMVIKNRRCRPLSEYSVIVRALPPALAHRRLYVKQEDFERANKLKKKIQKGGRK